MRTKVVFVDMSDPNGEVIKVSNLSAVRAKQTVENVTETGRFYERTTNRVYELLEVTEWADEEIVVWCVPYTRFNL